MFAEVIRKTSRNMPERWLFFPIKKGYVLMSNYGVVPEFKAGLNLGLVTVAEVGEIKKELAYGFEFLGDVILRGKEESVNIYAVNAT